MNLEQKVDSLVDTLAAVQKDMTSVKNDCHTIKRGMYGDKENLVIGLIQRQVQDEIDIKNLKNNWKKLIWMCGGFIVAVELIWIAIKTLL